MSVVAIGGRATARRQHGVFKLIKVNQSSQTKNFGLKSSVMGGEGVRHPTPPIQRILSHFNLTPTYSF